MLRKKITMSKVLAIRIANDESGSPLSRRSTRASVPVGGLSRSERIYDCTIIYVRDSVEVAKFYSGDQLN